MPHRCHFMGLRALYNGIVKFTRRPRPAREHDREGRAGIEGCAHDLEYRPPDDPRGVRRFVETAARRSAANGPRERVQWGVPIGQHYAIAGKIAEMAGNTFAMEAMTFLTSRAGRSQGRRSADRNRDVQNVGDGDDLEDRGRSDAGARRPRLRDRAVARRARRGSRSAVERFLRDCRINMIFEGSSEIMRLFIAREALDPHLKVGGAIFNTQLPMIDARSSRCSARARFTRAGIRNSGWAEAPAISTSCMPICVRT